MAVEFLILKFATVECDKKKDFLFFIFSLYRINDISKF